MHFRFQQFEQYIDETILARGLSYYKNGHVNQPEEITPGLFEAIVEGTENYTVRLRLEKGIVTEHVCDCPYDFGPVCKHVVAVLFHLQQEELELEQSSRSKKLQPGSQSKKTTPIMHQQVRDPGSQKRSKRKTVAQQVDELLGKLSDDELRQFVREQAGKDRSFRRMLLSTFAHPGDSKSRATCHREIKAILKSAMGEFGFIDWHSVRYVGKAVGDMLDIARNHFKSGNYQSAIWIACAVLEEMTEALQFADDSNADIGSNIDGAYDLLADIASRELPEEIRKELFKYTLQAFKKGTFSGWDWHIGMIEIAAGLFRNDSEAELVIALLDRVDGNESKFEFQQAQTIKLEVLKRTRGEAAAKAFMEQNLSNPYLREEAIQSAISKKQHEKAIALARDGIAHDADKPGLVMGWYDWLLKIALEQKDTERTIEYARLLFVDSIREKQPYYDILKAHVRQEEWGSFVEELETL